MRLGATISTYVQAEDPEAYVAECLKCGYRAASAPKVAIEETDRIRAIKQAFAKTDIVIAEVGAFFNALDPRPEERAKNLKTVAEGLAIADELGAKCCVNVVGSFDDRISYGPHPDNFADSAFDATVEWVRQILRQVKPRRAKLALEMSPWTLLDGPEIYREILEAVDHPGLAVHLDPANAVRDAHLYFSTTALLNRCFDLLGQWIVACHAKDILQDPDPRTVRLEEVVPGRGILDYRTFLSRLEVLSPDTPLIIEHLSSDEEYQEAADYIRSVAHEIGVTV